MSRIDSQTNGRIAISRIVFMTKCGRAKKRTACVNINNDFTVQCLQQAGTQSGGRRDMRRSMIITDCHENESFPLMKCIRRYV